MNYLLTTLAFLYIVFILYIMYGIYLARKKDILVDNLSPFSIIVCTNNGNVLEILDTLKKVTCEVDFELIVVDDRSFEPITIDTVNYNFEIKLITISEIMSGVSPKKNGLNLAVRSSKYKKILTFDDDTIFDENYLNEVSKLDIEQTEYITGLIKPYTKKDTLFSNFAILDFISFNLISIACIKQDVPIFSNANNQLFNRDTFLEIAPYSDNMNILSGDDTYLLQKFHSNFKSTTSLYSHDFVTETEVPSHFKEFINQRIRWVSMSHRVKSTKVVVLSILLYLYNLLLVCSLFTYPFLFLKILIVKTILDTTLLLPALNQFKMTRKIKYMFISEFIMIFYVSVLPILGIYRGNKKW